MKVTAILPLFAFPAVLAVPSSEQKFLGGVEAVADAIGGPFVETGGSLKHVFDDVFGAKGEASKWIADGREFVKQNGLVYELVSHPALEQHQLRLTEPDLCDASVQQYSGYLDIEEDKHLFFWFFEARNSPSEAPLVLWLNGGPGCSSSTGLLFELGPCSISSETNVTYNKHSWINNANIIFLDQPVNVGFSYATDGKTVNTSPLVAKDVYAFIELFLTRFQQYERLPFHIAAESYGGMYAPNIASVIHTENKAPAQGLVHINLKSVILANGLTDPYEQMASVPDWACDGPYAVYSDTDGPECQALRAKVPTCQRMLQSCNDYNSRLTCVPASLYCNSQILGPLVQLDHNPYDVRRKCDHEVEGGLCYPQMTWIDAYMNQPEVKRALGVDSSRKFASCNSQINQAFLFQGDGAHNRATLLPPLIEDGIRLLVYAGQADMMCNFIGNERWVEKLETQFSNEFALAETLSWVTPETGKVSGTVRSAGGHGYRAGNVTFVAVHEAGHMVPYDQPEAALDLITRWLMDVPLA